MNEGENKIHLYIDDDLAAIILTLRMPKCYYSKPNNDKTPGTKYFATYDDDNKGNNSNKMVLFVGEKDMDIDDNNANDFCIGSSSVKVCISFINIVGDRNDVDTYGVNEEHKEDEEDNKYIPINEERFEFCNEYNSSSKIRLGNMSYLTMYFMAILTTFNNAGLLFIVFSINRYVLTTLKVCRPPSLTPSNSIYGTTIFFITIMVCSTFMIINLSFAIYLSL
jgi:hypothetical protein